MKKGCAIAFGVGLTFFALVAAGMYITIKSMDGLGYFDFDAE